MKAKSAKGTLAVLHASQLVTLAGPKRPRVGAELCDLIDAGLAVVIATDFNPGSSPTPSMQMVLSLAATQMKMTPAEAITAATINAAYSLKRGEKIGSLEAGKIANFALYDCEDYRELAYWFGFPEVHSVYVRGETISW